MGVLAVPLPSSADADVRRAARSGVVKGLGRFGLAARATVYLLLGILALTLADGAAPQEADQRGALAELSRHAGGAVLVGVIAVGLFGYAVWRFCEALVGVVGEGKKAGPRLQSLARGVVYLVLGVNAARIALGSGGGNQSGEQQALSARAMEHTAGRWAVGVVGVIVIVVGAVLIWEGVTRRFEKYLDTGSASPAVRRAVEVLGVVGTATRGVVFALAGVFVVVAAVEQDPGKAGGLDVALRELQQTSAGPVLLILVALGLIVFGVYGYAEARWRRT